MATVLDALKATFTPQGTAGRTSLLDTLISSQLSNRQNAMLRQRGMMGMAQGLLAASAPSTKPVSMGQALSTGITGMEQGRQTALNEMLIGSQITKNLITDKGADLRKLEGRKEAIRTYAKDNNLFLTEEKVSYIANAMGTGSTTELAKNTGIMVDKMGAMIEEIATPIKTGEDPWGTEEDTIIEEEGYSTSGTEELQIENFNRKIRDLGDDASQANMGRTFGAILELNKVIPKGDIKNIPGYADYIGKLPKFLSSTEGKRFQRRLEGLFNIELKDRSGVAVTIPELTRLREEFAQGVFQTEESLLQAINEYKNIVKNHISTVLGGYEPEVVEEYLKRAGFDLDEIFKGKIEFSDIGNEILKKHKIKKNQNSKYNFLGG